MDKGTKELMLDYYCNVFYKIMCFLGFFASIVIFRIALFKFLTIFFSIGFSFAFSILFTGFLAIFSFIIWLSLND